MSVPPEIRNATLDAVNRALREIGGVVQELPPTEAKRLAEERASLATWTHTASLKELDGVINFINRTRF